MAAAIPYLLIAAGAGVAAHSQKRVAERQKKIIDEMQAFQGKKAKEGEKSIDDYLQTISPTARAAESQQAREQLQQGLEHSVGAAQAFETSDPIAGRVSGDFIRRRAENEAALKERTRRAIEQLATIGTPSEQQLRQQQRFGRAAGGVDAANTSINAVRPAFDASISAVRPAPFETFLSQVLMGIGGGMAGGAGGAGGSIFASEPNRRSANLGRGGYNYPRTR